MGPRKPFLLRIDPALWAELEAWAQADLRSVNGQIEWILRQALETRRGATRRPAPPAAKSDEAPEEGKSGGAG
jgi:hypothetical protein